MARELIWVEEERFHGWACSVCAWKFKTSGPLTGGTMDEMKQNYECQRDQEFKAHVCAKHPKWPAENPPPRAR